MVLTSRLEIFELNFFFCRIQYNFIRFCIRILLLFYYANFSFLLFKKLNNLFKAILLENIKFQKNFLNLNFYFYSFCIIRFFNLFSLLPFHYTITAQFLFTFIMSFLLFRTLTMHGLIQHKTKFLNIFLPAGIPFPLYRYIIIIEFISYISRLFSLSGRLFRNLVAGHVLLYIISASRVSVFFFVSIWSIFSILRVSILILIFLLEIVISLLQAYVFILLVCIFTDNILIIEH
jgi:F-type H+-transporting ATPase subunit a